MGRQANETEPIKHICAGLLAHVDAGKTTLSEGILYLTGGLRKLGRVDHGDAFLDNFALERSRGITIFSKQAVFPLGETEVTLIDTPGHVDFSAEMERALWVMDYAVLVVMNEAFDAGERIVTSCRASKNFGDNWISASYALHWLRTVRMEHRARSVFGLATRIQGTGFLFASELVKNGWHYTSLTEDRAFTADAVAAGYPISYCDAAVFYDEQPVSLRIALRQRIRLIQRITSFRKDSCCSRCFLAFDAVVPIVFFF